MLRRFIHAPQGFRQFDTVDGCLVTSAKYKKCKVVSYGRKSEICTNYNISGETIDKIESIKDLGVTFDNKLKFDDHIYNKISKAYQMLGIVKRNFIYLTPDSFAILYKSMIRSHLEYAVSVWNPHYQSLIEKLEKIQKRATKLVLTVKKLCYEERLRKLKLPTLKYRRIRGDMIEMYKIFAGKYDSEITEWITGKCTERQYDTRNHRYALQQSHIHYDIRKFSFSNRIIPLWHSLPDNIVSSPTLNTFKARLDKFWENQDIRYNWKADVLFTGSRSKVELTVD